MRKLISCLFFLVLTSCVLMAQVNRQLKKLDQYLTNYELEKGTKKVEKLAKKITNRHKYYDHFLYQQAQLLRLKGHYQQALKKIQIILKNTPPENQAKTWMLQGKIAYDLEDYVLAERSLIKALLLQTQNNPNDFLLKAAINTYLGGIKVEQESYLKADSLYASAQKILERHQQINHILYPEILYRIAESQYQQDKIKEAQNILDKSSASLNLLVSSTHPEQAFIWIHQGMIYLNSGQYAEAEQAFLKALGMNEHIYGKEHPLHAKTLRNLARSYFHQGKYAKAEALLIEVKNSKLLSKGTPSYAFTMSTLGILYEEIGKYQQAIAAYTVAKDIFKSLNNTSKFTICLNNLAGIYSTINQTQKSTLLFEEGKAFLEANNNTNSQIYAVILINLGLNYVDESQLEKAKITLETAKALVLKLLGKEHSYYASVIINLAHLYEKTNQLEKARDFYLESEKIDKLVLGEQHPYFMSTLSNTANIYALLEKPDTAYQYYHRLLEGQTNLIFKHYSTFEENTRLSYLKESMDYFEEFHSFVARTDTINPTAYVDMQNVSLATKNLALDFSVDHKVQLDSTRDAQTYTVYEEWTALRQKLGQAYTLSEQERKQADLNLAELEAQTILLEKQLVRRNDAVAKKIIRQQLVTFEEMQTALDADEAAIDFIKFQYYLPTRKTDSIYYAALITQKDIPHPQYIFLAEEKQLARILKAKIRANGSNYVVNPKIGYDLYQLLWQPLEAYLKDIKTIKIAPTGLLHKVAFGALPTNAKGNQNLLQQYRFDYYGNMREVVKATEINPFNNKNIALVGGAHFDMDSTALHQLSLNPSADNILNKAINSGEIISEPDVTRGTLKFNYLRGTEQEVQSIETQFKAQNWQVSIYLQATALEDNVKALSGETAPSILHLATHGFFFTKPKKTNKEALILRDRIKQSNNPLIRSGLVFTGVNHTWKGGGRIPNLDDGVLTAYEISNLNLQNTDLVVLSACETGLGDIYDTEGVFGLQRAFKTAGAQNLLISLWKVPDQQTTQLMTSFYQFYLQSQNPSDALHQAQLAMSQQYPAYYWGAFILAK